MTIECLVLGAGQEVGKSCIIVTLGSKRIMFDCGMHMGYVDNRRFPDFSLLSETGDFNAALTCVIITHFHLDHVGALPYFTEVCGYSGPIFMTYPTKALAPLMLEDYRKVMVDRRGEEEQFTYNHILECMKKVTPLDLKQTIQVDKDLEIRAYYAGHVLGAAMVYAKVGENSIVYTGDYNMTPDRHLGAAQIDRLQLDLLITESTYATTIRDSKYAREREFLRVVHKCISGGGKVLIPTFALGRAQELCILLDDYWERMNLKVPIYFSAGLTIQANMYYKMLIGWASQKIKETSLVRNTFDFKHVCPFDRSLLNAPGPCVLFATPGMISGGFSLEVFKQWAPSELNLITLPGLSELNNFLIELLCSERGGRTPIYHASSFNVTSSANYCVAGTIGHKLMSGKPTRIDLDKDTHIEVRCQIHQLSFSPHTDAKGIMDLVEFLSPKHVILVHGEKPKMATLKERIQSELGIQCYYPANNETVLIPRTQNLKLDATKMFISSFSNTTLNDVKKRSLSVSDSSSSGTEMSVMVRGDQKAEGILVMEKNKTAKIIHEDELLRTLGVKEQKIQMALCCPVEVTKMVPVLNKAKNILHRETFMEVDAPRCSAAQDMLTTEYSLLRFLVQRFETKFECKHIQISSNCLQLLSFRVSICSNEYCPYRTKEKHGVRNPVVYFCCRWSAGDDKLARELILLMGN